VSINHHPVAKGASRFITPWNAVVFVGRNPAVHSLTGWPQGAHIESWREILGAILACFGAEGFLCQPKEAATGGATVQKCPSWYHLMSEASHLLTQDFLVERAEYGLGGVKA
jgi:hypothetical protein